MKMKSNDNEFLVILLVVIIVMLFTIGMGIKDNMREIINRLSAIETAVLL